ncbi:MAG TPA: hypothetical protein PK637_06880 [Flavobacteriales bacterium]|nr:hypothetical protein [Flavobacteriales bacterium]
MHSIEPHYNWRTLYCAEEDPRSPVYGREYSEFEFQNHVYDHYIHPQWDEIGSQTLYLKQLYTDYTEGYVILELIGEWNDCLYNDVMVLKRDFIELLIGEGISKFILVGENVLNFHASDDCYYEEWFDEASDQGGWIALVNFRDHVIADMQDANIDSYLVMGGKVNEIDWRTMHPHQFYQKVERFVQRRLDA